MRYIFLARYMLSPVRLSVRLSVTRVDHTKTIEVRIMKFSPYGSPVPLVFAGKFHPEILRGFNFKQGRVGKIGSFQYLSVNISKTIADTAKVTIND